MQDLNLLRDEFDEHIFVKFNYGLINILSTEFEEEIYSTEDEIYELWGISEYLAKILKKHGEICFNFYGLWIWGRTCTGQSIYLDSVFSDIYKDLT